MRFAPEGRPFILVPALLMVAGMLIGQPWLTMPLLAVTLFMCWFFRDPDRTVPADPNVFVAPADGKVIVVREVFEDRHLQKDALQISIFMSPLNVHVNRAPCDGSVASVKHFTGRFMAAYRDAASIENEHIDMVLDTAYGGVLVRQVAGFVARRAVCRVNEGERLQRGERYGIIKFSSRVDIYLPKNAAAQVAVNDAVRAGESVLAKMGL